MHGPEVNGSHESICLEPSALDARSIAAHVDRRTCRFDFDAPGVCVINLGRESGSIHLRRLMVAIKRELARIHETATGNTLAYLTADRFEQQETTRLHLDGGPDECLLMLGYEPSPIDSVMEVADYSRCAFDLGLSPAEFMAKHNPMFSEGHDLLRPYTTRLPRCAASDYRIVCINNSCAPWSESAPAWQGVLHGASVPEPDERASRVVNSTMIASVPAGTADTIDAAALEAFIAGTDRRRGYAGAD
jgi:hypothetical protein